MAVPVITTVLTSDLTKPVEVVSLNGVFFTGDSNANVIAVDVYNNGAAASLSGSVKGYVILPNHSTLPAISGTLSGNRASITLPAEAYVLEGAIDIVIKVESGSGTSAVKTAVGACRGYVARTTTATAYDPASVTPSVEELEYWIEQCETASGEANTAATKLTNMDATATALAATASPTATVTTVSGHYRLNLGIPVGVPPNLTIGTVTTGAAGSSAAASITGTATDPVLNLTIPRGNTGAKGNTGNTGATPNLTIGSVTKGTNASASITGTTPDLVLNLVLPKGDKGATGAAGTDGATGATPALSIGTVTTGAAGTNASVTISGTNEAPVLNFTIPRGAKGNAGNVSSVNGVSPDANGNVTIGMGDIDTGTIPVNKGGTGATTAANALVSLGAVAKAGDSMTGQLYAPNVSAQASNSSSYPRLYLRDVAGNPCISFLQTSPGNGRLRIREATDPSGVTTGYEDYRLPLPTYEQVEGASEGVNYDILTSKSPVTVAQGGTGATDEATALTNLGAVAIAGSNMTGVLNMKGTQIRYATAEGADLLHLVARATGAFTVQSQGNGFYENFNFPAPDAGSNKNYNVLTDKAAVTVAQGGTNATTAAGARTNLGLAYSAGETYASTTSASYRPMWSGAVASDSKSLILTVITDKTLENVTSIAVTTFTGWIYGVTGAIESSTTTTAWATNYTVTAVKAANNAVRITIKKTDSTAFSGVTASTPISASVNTVLTFS